MKKNNYYVEMANYFADLIEQSNAPWQKPWKQGSNSIIPVNINTGREYSNMNFMKLLDVQLKRNYSDNRWLTYKQALDLGGYVKKGEKGVPILYLVSTETLEKEVDGKIIKEKVKLAEPKAVWSVVFNAEQCENIPEREKNLPFEPIEKAEQLLQSSGAKIEHKNQNRAYYDSYEDKITLPPKENFISSEEYYLTALHELGHWTGHESRLNRELGNTFGSSAYAREELVAEITSFLTGTHCGLGHEPTKNNVAYIREWAKEIRKDPSMLFNVIKDADRACNLIIGKTKQQELENNQEIYMDNQETSVIYIKVDISEKDEAKALGAKWDSNLKSWFVPANEDINKFSRWETIEKAELIKIKEQNHQDKNIKDDKFYLAVPFSEKDAAKALGAEWDDNTKSWYCADQDKDKFQRWFVTNVENKVNTSQSSRNIEEEFFNEISKLGAIGNPSDIYVDGFKHRIQTEGDRGTEASGFYVVYPDGVPAGYFMNNRTGEEIKWVSTGYTITKEQREEAAAIVAARKAEREQISAEQQEKAEKQLYAKFKNKEDINQDHQYLKNKNIDITPNIYAGNNNSITVPIYNMDGFLKSAQYINEDGEKRFAKNTNKTGCFHMIEGNPKELKEKELIIITEGYATAASVNEAVKDKKIAVVAAMSANNLEPVVQAIKEKYQDKSIIIACDNDIDNKVGNIGLNKANEVADKFNNVVVAIPKISGDFNDMVSKIDIPKENALSEIKSTINTAINKLNHINKQQQQMQQQQSQDKQQTNTNRR